MNSREVFKGIQFSERPRKRRRNRRRVRAWRLQLLHRQPPSRYRMRNTRKGRNRKTRRRSRTVTSPRLSSEQVGKFYEFTKIFTKTNWNFFSILIFLLKIDILLLWRQLGNNKTFDKTRSFLVRLILRLSNRSLSRVISCLLITKSCYFSIIIVTWLFTVEKPWLNFFLQGTQCKNLNENVENKKRFFSTRNLEIFY